MQVHLVEVFSSVQGEGPELGLSTLFIRLGECDLRCRWCDSPHTWQRPSKARLERGRGEGLFEEVPSPLELEAVLAAAERLEPEAHRSLSLTGGEPLLQPAAVRALAEALRGRGPQILLETHGLHAQALAQVLPVIDVVSMDWKLASDVRRRSDPLRGGIRPFHEAHRRFLCVARKAPRVVVKLVLTTASRDEELQEAVRCIAAVHPRACVVLQPVTPRKAAIPPPAERLLALERRFSRQLPDVRVIPQTHPLVGVP